MTPLEPYKDPKSLTRALQVLAIADVVLCTLDLSLGLAAGWPGPMGKDHANLFIGLIALTLIIQCVIRVISFLVRARWTFRLVSNARRFHALPVTERWAWLGFFIPVISLWVPLTIHQALLASNAIRGDRLPIVLAVWWLVRLATCLSGTFIIAVILAVMLYRGDPTYLSLSLILVPAIAGLPCATLSFILVRTIARRQPSPDIVQQAEVF